MTPLEWLRLPLRYRPWRPLHLRLVAADLWGREGRPHADHRAHLEAAIDWLCRAQDRRDGERDAGGVAAGWSFEDGWLPAYPETTGYIIETFIAAAPLLGRPELERRAARMIDWELSLQGPDGAFPGHFGEPGSRPVIFNTGQIMHGMLAGHLALGRDDCLEAAVRAGHWLARHQGADGAWHDYEHNGIPHVYNTRATWALLATGRVAGEASLVDAAKAHLEWALARREGDGWFRENAFTPGQAPFLHTIAYAIRGLLECGRLLGDERYLSAAEDAAAVLAGCQRADGWLAGAYGQGWRPAGTYCCLTGLAQMVLDWQRLDQIRGDARFAGPARLGLDYLESLHRLEDPADPVRGGVAGSYPIWGAYSRFEFPNWAAKFFADALIMALTGRPLPAEIEPHG